MPEIEYVFLDNGGVLTDNTRRAPEYQRLVGEYFAPRYGGTPEEWAVANVDTFMPAWRRFGERVANWDEARDLAQAEWLYHADWLRFLFAAAGVPAPDDDDECARIGKAAERWINPQIVTLFPGVEEAVRRLAARYRLFTASDGFSGPLSETLAPVAHAFERLYGPAIVNIPKQAGHAYYGAVFAHANVDPARALVLDDNLPNVLAARESGARVVFVSSEPGAGYDGPSISRLSGRPDLIGRL